MISALGWSGSALVLASLAQSNQYRFRVLNLAASVVLLVVNVAVGLMPMVVLNAALAIVNIRFLIRPASRAAQANPTETRARRRRPETSSLLQQCDERG
jgi:hypothetical protein